MISMANLLIIGNEIIKKLHGLGHMTIYCKSLKNLLQNQNSSEPEDQRS